MLFQKGVTAEDSKDDDLYSMLIPGESDRNNIQRNSSNKKQNFRSPFEENLPFDNLYQFQALQKPEAPL